MNYFWIWIYVAAVVGVISGFFLCAVLSAKKSRPLESFNIDTVSNWIRTREQPEMVLKAVVRQALGGIMHSHSNPVKKKAPAKYPVSER